MQPTGSNLMLLNHHGTLCIFDHTEDGDTDIILNIFLLLGKNLYCIIFEFLTIAFNNFSYNYILRTSSDSYKIYEYIIVSQLSLIKCKWFTIINLTNFANLT